MKIGIVDYGTGNLHSIKRALDRININSLIATSVGELRSCDKLILPGVGHFGNAIAHLESNGLRAEIEHAAFNDRKYILGICLGMELFARHSEEGDCEGLNWLDANVVRFKIADKLKFKVPAIGWNEVRLVQQHPLFFGIPDATEFYFLHSFHLTSPAGWLVAETDYESKYASAIANENIYGVQFHPEKSHDVGLQLLENFTRL